MGTTRENLEGLLDRQRQLEAMAVGQGKDRFEKRLQEAQDAGRGASFGAAKRLLSEGTAAMIPAVERWIEERRSGPGRPHAALDWIEKSGPEAASYITMLEVLHFIYTEQNATWMARRITDRLALEWRARKLEEEAPGLFNYKLPKLRKASTLRHAKFALMQTVDYAGIEVGMPTEYQRVQVGLVLLDLAQAATGLFKMETVNENKRNTIVVSATEDTDEWLLRQNEVLAEASRLYRPMVVPPRDWRPGVRGGYLYGLRNEVPLVRTWDRTHADVVEEADMPLMYDAINKLQRTPWRINKRVYGVVKKIMEQGGGGYDPSRMILVDRASVPALEPVPMPPKPPDFGEDEEATRLWRREASYRKEVENTERKGRAITFWYTMSAAREHLRDNAIFFVWGCDFRGRLYPVAGVGGLSPQGNDLSRGLLEFYEAKPLGTPEAVDALALHGANLLDEWNGRKVGTMTRQERIELVEDLSILIKNAAQDPLANRWWEEADKPLMFLAFCFDWAGYLTDGLDHVSRLPVHVDGSCNGVQHMAAMVRDVETAREVNVTANPRPRDLYQNMADHANKVMARRAVSEEDERVRWVCQQWVQSGLITRKACKRPTMTFGYGGTEYGYTDQIRDFFKGEGLHPTLVEDFWRDGDEKSSVGLAYRTLASVLYSGLEDVVPGAVVVRNWLQAAAGDAVAEGQDHINWTVPVTGFPVYQRYNRSNSVKVDTTLSGGVRYQPRVNVVTDEPDTRRHVNGIAPNYVHSLDAAHLAITLSMLGDVAVSTVHDSYGTHACDMPSLEAALRGAFVRLYSEDVLAVLAEDLGVGREIPEDGDLDITEVRASEYFFV